MRRCTMIRQHHTLHIHFIQVCLDIKQSLCSSRHKRLHVLLVSQKLTLGNYLQCNRRTKPDRKPKPIPAQGNYPQGYLGQKASVTATNVLHWNSVIQWLGELICVGSNRTLMAG